MENYEISNTTIALIYRNNKTIVYDNNDQFIVNKLPNEIINNSCKFYGSSFIGRVKGTEFMLGIKNKVPIIVEESNNIIFFPTSSYKLKTCSWISIKYIKDYFKISNNTSRIITENNRKIDLDISYFIINNQILRSYRLESILNRRKM